RRFRAQARSARSSSGDSETGAFINSKYPCEIEQKSAGSPRSMGDEMVTKVLWPFVSDWKAKVLLLLKCAKLPK
ncbi:MAG: hypothetical protein WA180_09170, partial [Candidatus Sulfotelmatobacter sp.]